MRYDCVVKYADKESGTFRNFKLQATPISPSEEEQAVHHNVTHEMADKLDWMEIFEEMNHSNTRYDAYLLHLREGRI